MSKWLLVGVWISEEQGESDKIMAGYEWGVRLRETMNYSRVINYE